MDHVAMLERMATVYHDWPECVAACRAGIDAIQESDAKDQRIAELEARILSMAETERGSQEEMEELTAEIAELEAQRDEAVKLMGDWSQRCGEADGAALKLRWRIAELEADCKLQRGWADAAETLRKSADHELGERDRRIAQLTAGVRAGSAGCQAGADALLSAHKRIDELQAKVQKYKAKEMEREHYQARRGNTLGEPF